MWINKKVVKAKFLRRPNRFQAYVKLENQEIEECVHVPNTGRCKEILIAGAKVILREELNPARKTRYDLIAVYKGSKLINIDSQIPNKVVDEALRLNNIEGLEKYDIIEREKTFGNSRFDFKLKSSKDMKEYYLEVKGVTLEENGHAMFPDAPTERGRKHVIELEQVLRHGKGAGILFLIQMEDVNNFSPNDITDVKFADSLRHAYNCGVQVMAYACKTTERSITLNERVQVIL
ncbi:DNA/RNA nuclease SfsA [Clostridium oryzae]|uniref:Sugar fermentation stimulation protein homolog n=1 Tax=Clostridium oryzae TaxID=1450648 RepID=A0A1V4IEK5_9CLOT|nr:DNA/RNA nuclease SfsA [Clostridium oryzae]OPJ58383.1 sugar fermentation stimulation protein A [Clostridium oryzae]